MSFFLIIFLFLIVSFCSAPPFAHEKCTQGATNLVILFSMSRAEGRLDTQGCVLFRGLKNNTFTSVAPLQSGDYTIILHGVVYYNTIVISAQSNYTFFADSAQPLLSVLGKLFRASVDSECLSLEASTSLNMM